MSATAERAATPDAQDISRRILDAMETGGPEAFEEVCHPLFFNHEQLEEPPGSRGRGPATAYATALWLREAFDDLRWEIHDVVAEGDLIAFHSTMSGRHVRPFVGYAEDATVDEVFPPTGKRFETTQTHWMRVVDDKVIEHWANRDDLGTAKQLGWVPPTPVYLLRMALAKRRARRAHAA
jgi:predicted ester cyclase